MTSYSPQQGIYFCKANKMYNVCSVRGEFIDTAYSRFLESFEHQDLQKRTFGKSSENVNFKHIIESDQMTKISFPCLTSHYSGEHA